MTTNAHEALTEAETALMAYLDQRRRPDALGFDEFCARQPDMATELQLLYGSLRRISGVLKRSSRSASSAWPRGWWKIA
jgi:hypothetical protein